MRPQATHFDAERVWTRRGPAITATRLRPRRTARLPFGWALMVWTSPGRSGVTLRPSARRPISLHALGLQTVADDSAVESSTRTVRRLATESFTPV